MQTLLCNACYNVLFSRVEGSFSSTTLETKRKYYLQGLLNTQNAHWLGIIGERCTCCGRKTVIRRA